MGFVAVRLNAVSYPVEPAEQRELEQADAKLIAIEGQRPDEIIGAAEHCDALLVVSSSVPASVIERLTNCRVISRLGAGTDKIDIAAATRKGIVVANIPDFCTNEQAEHTFSLLLAWARRLPFMFDAMRRGQWTARNHPGVHRVAGQTLGLIGFGASAQAVATRGAAFGMRVLAWTRNPDKYAAAAQRGGVTLTTLERTLAEADFVSLHLPLTAETRGLIGTAQIALMKPSAVLINAARGAIVDEVALISALKLGRIGGAALDVFDGINVFALPGEPPPHPLFELDNVLLTPHCAGSSVESTLDSKTRGARHAADVLRGRWPEHVVNPDVTPRNPLA
ncbi:MAG TPA: C-terminal binding protein [Planctomycetaceae bacterium]|jgi:D-3-phosphoglycerate dehydrogenase|nr:C-terminal binding protein [Planctomycetaceae bacterium]